MLFVQVIEIRASYNSFLCCLLLLTQLQNTQRRPKWCATFFKGEEDFILVAMSRKIKGSLHLLRLLYNEVWSKDALLKACSCAKTKTKTKLRTKVFILNNACDERTMPLVLHYIELWVRSSQVGFRTY